MKTLEMNLSGSLYWNSLMPSAWYLISTSHILPSLVHSRCSNYAVVLAPCLCTLSNSDSLTNFLVYSVCLFSLTPSFHVLFGVSFKLSDVYLHLIS